MIVPVILEGSWVALLPLTLDHVEPLCQVGLDPRLWQATTIKVRTPEEMDAYVRAAIEAQSAGTALPFVIVERGTGTIIGSTRYHSAVPEHKRVEIGFTWISVPWQGTMVNKESKYLMLRHAFDELDCVRVEFRANVANEQSCRGLLRIGAKQEGVLRSYRLSPTGEKFDLAIFSIIAAEWPEVRADLEDIFNRPRNRALEPLNPGVTPPAG